MAAAKKILIVDDEVDLALLLQMIFEKQGYQTVLAHSGRAALAIVEREHVDAIVTDIRMPQGDGVELLEKVRKQNQTKPVIVLVTGYSDLTQAEAYDRGAQAIFTKPFNKKAILETLERLLGSEPIASAKPETRFSADLQVNVRLSASSAGSTTALGFTANVGRGGMFVALEGQRLPFPDERVNFQMQLEASRTVSGQGVCRWVRESSADNLPRGFGLEFLEIAAQDHESLLQIIQNLRTHAYIPQR